MKGKILFLMLGVVLLGWFFLFQGLQTVNSSPIYKITITPTATATLPPTLPPPPLPTDPPLIPVTGMGDELHVDGLVIGGLVVLILGVVGMAWPGKKTRRQR